jgi:hypothetical protein
MFPGPGDQRLIDIFGWAEETDQSGNLFIVGIEVTQGIQYARADRHLADPADRMPDNSARLVAGKPAWVRVYVRSWFGEWGVTGTLGVRRRRRFMWPSVATLAPRPPGTIVAPRPQWVESNLAGERSSLAATLNFVIPADLMCGELRLTARVQGRGAPAVKSITIDVTLRRTLRLAGIFVSYNGPANTNPGAQVISVPAPTMQTFQTTAADTLTLYPVRSQADFRDAGTLAWTTALEQGVASDGSCLPNWIALLTAVANQMTADGNQPGFVYYGVLPLALGGGGCGGGGLAVGPTGHITDGLTMAHEIGHACGLWHAPCGVIGDPGYPAYEPYDPAAMPQGSIGEYGLDVNNGAIKAPGSFKDLMSYCWPKWISLYHHGALFGSSALNPESVCLADLWWLEVAALHDPIGLKSVAAEDVISLIAVIRADRILEVRHVARTLTRPPAISTATGMTARLVGEDDVVLAAAPLRRLGGLAGCGCGGDADEVDAVAQALIPNVASGARIEIVAGEEVIWSRAAPPRPPEIARFTCRVVKGAVRAAWRAPTATDCWLRWSRDGEEWRALATGLTGGRTEVAARHLPPGPVQIQLVAHDGFSSTHSTPVGLEIAARAPDVAVMHPRPGAIHSEGQTLRLFAAAASASGEPIPPESWRWTLDGGDLGEGELWIEAPAPGEHVLGLRVSTVDGETADEVRFTTVPAEDVAGDG